MSEPKFHQLDNRALINIGGEEAEAFLQGILTCNIELIARDDAGFGGLLTPQGKILFDFFVVRNGDAFFLDVYNDQVEELIRRLTFYRLRAKVTIEPEEKLRVYAVWGGDAPAANDAAIVRDPRLADMGWRVYSTNAPSGSVSGSVGEYDHHRILTGMPEGGIDYYYGDAFPHEALYDQTGGVDFSKGCYVGQEVVSRMHHRGTGRKRVLQIEGNSALPATGTKITAGGKPVGESGSATGNKGLAMLRLDRVKHAMDAGIPLMAGEIEISAHIQAWVNFDWPGE